MVERYFFGYETNSNPTPDFEEAGVELKCTPLKELADKSLQIKERLVCAMIDYSEDHKHPFKESHVYIKCAVMLLLFYLHQAKVPVQQLRFLYSVLWQIPEKDLLIMEQDYDKIIAKIRCGKAHELSEGDTTYLGACRKGQKGDADVSNYADVLQEDDWYESRLYELFTSRFLFIVFRDCGDNAEEDYRLQKAFFWSMPYGDLQDAGAYWQNIRDNIAANRIEAQYFYRESEHSKFHIRPKAYSVLSRRCSSSPSLVTIPHTRAFPIRKARFPLSTPLHSVQLEGNILICSSSTGVRRRMHPVSSVMACRHLSGLLPPSEVMIVRAGLSMESGKSIAPSV